MRQRLLAAAAVIASFAAAPVLAQTSEITIGITTSTTGPAAALGIPERNALEFVPKEIGGVPLKLIVLDDGGDPAAATTNERRFVTESKADIILGSATTPADDCGPERRQRGRHSAFRPVAVSGHARARQMVCRDAAAGANHGQGA